MGVENWQGPTKNQRLVRRNGARVNGFDFRVTGEVAVVEGQDAADVMDAHRCSQAGVMDLHTGDTISDEEFAPLFVDGEAVGKQPQLFFEQSGSAVGFLRRQAIAVAIERTSAGVPEFSKIL